MKHVRNKSITMSNTHSCSHTYPNVGPATERSNTWAGFSNCLKRRMNFTPWLSPLFEFTNTTSGLRLWWIVSQTPGPMCSARFMVVAGMTERQFRPRLHRRWNCILHPLWTCDKKSVKYVHWYRILLSHFIILTWLVPK